MDYTFNNVPIREDQYNTLQMLGALSSAGMDDRQLMPIFMETLFSPPPQQDPLAAIMGMQGGGMGGQGFGAQGPGMGGPGFGAQGPGMGGPGFGAQGPGMGGPGFGAQGPGMGGLDPNLEIQIDDGAGLGSSVVGGFRGGGEMIARPYIENVIDPLERRQTNRVREEMGNVRNDARNLSRQDFQQKYADDLALGHRKRNPFRRLTQWAIGL